MAEFRSEILGVPRTRRWSAAWIWSDDAGTGQNMFRLVRNGFKLDKKPEAATLFISADTRYKLFVNGTFVDHGPPQSQPYFQYYDEHDLAPLLRKGENVIAAIVQHTGVLADARGGFLVELTEGDGRVLLATGRDAGWRVLDPKAWRTDTFRFRMNLATPFQEHLDARRLPAGWTEPGFDDANWQPAQTITGRHGDRVPAAGPWIFLQARDIPPMTRDPVRPVAIERVEECLDLMNRTRSEDVSISLSMPGRDLQTVTAENVEALVTGEGDCVLATSTGYLDRSTDGRHDPAITLDFGRILIAYPRIELDGIDGAVLEVGYAERLIDGRFNNSLEGQFAERYTMTDGPQTFEPFHWKAFRYLRLRVREAPQPVKIRNLQAIVSTFPFEESGAFACGDERLERVWQISRETLRLCSNEFLMDTPWREAAQWLGDVAAVTIGGLYACFGDTQLTGKFYRQSGANQFATGLVSNISNSANHRWQGAIPDYSLWWVMGVWQHYLYTGEATLLHELYPVTRRVMQAHYKHVNDFGLVEDMPLWVLVDWAHTDRRGECTAYNALFYGALEAFDHLAEHQGDDHSRRQVGLLRERMREHFQRRLFDPGRGCFADARVDDGLSPRTSEHASMAAIRFGLCDEATARAIIARFYESSDPPPYVAECQPFFTVVVLQALRRLRRMDLALKMIEDRWGKRMLDTGATSVYEEWTSNGSWRTGTFSPIMRTHSHAWSACPAEFLIRDLIGLEIVSPGCEKVRLSPAETPFDYDVTYPTRRGLIRVRRADGKAYVELPRGIERVA